MNPNRHPFALAFLATFTALAFVAAPASSQSPPADAPTDESSPTTEPATPRLKLTPDSVQVAMFKNGLAVVDLAVPLPPDGGACHLEAMPEAVMGTFWLSWPEGVALEHVKAAGMEVTRRIPASSIREVLESQIGQAVDIELDNRWQRVRIVDLPKPTIDPEAQLRRNDHPLGSIIVLEDGFGRRVTNVDSIRDVRLLDADDPPTVSRPTKEHVLQFDVRYTQADGPRPTHLYVQYLASGLAWIPSYILSLENPEQALLSAKAVIVNDMMAMKEANVQLIAGYPHLLYGDKPSPLASRPLRELFQLLSQGPNGRREVLANVMMAQSAAFDRGRVAEDRPMAIPTPLEGETVEDLYYYAVGPVTLDKGERAYVPMFATPVPIKHLHTWDIPDFVEGEQYQADVARQQSDVWHSLTVKNTTTAYWTTAPCTTQIDGRLLGQDLLHYTPPGADTELKINRAVAVDAKQEEWESSRERNAMQVADRGYDLVHVKGELTVTNYKDAPITLRIKKTISGEVVQADGQPTIVKLAEGVRRVNPRSQLTWEIDIEPGRDQALKLAYEYNAYVRN